MDCRFFRGNLSLGDRQFLLELLKQYDAKLMLESWVRKGQVKKPSGRYVDSGKARAVEILKREGFCGKEGVRVYAVDVGCVFYEPADKQGGRETSETGQA
jgi:hypothetical protein